MQSSFPTHLNNVYVYLRKSREDREAEERARREGRTDIETLSRHRRALLELAHKNHHNVTVIHEEVVSGEFISERPEMLKLLTSLDTGEIDAVWVMDLDRLGRGDMADQGRILRTFKETATLILTPDKVYDLNDEMDEEWTEFKTFFARRELKMITKRMQRGRVASVQEGKYIGTRPPFGYDVTRDLILVPNDNADTVRRIFDLYTRSDMGASRIAAHLNERGIKTPNGKLWRSESVISLIRNPVYAGWMAWRKTYSDKRHGRGTKRPREEWVLARGKHEPLIAQDVYDKAEQIRLERSHTPGPKANETASPLTSLIVCGKCGSKMVRRPYTKQAAHLRCANPHCTQKSTRLSLVEGRLLEILADWLSSYILTTEEVAAALTHKTEEPVSTKALSAIDREIERVTLQRDQLHNLLEQQVYDADTYLERNSKLLAEMADLRKRREAIEGDLKREGQLRQARRNVIPRMTRALDAYHKTNDVGTRNELLKSVLHHAIYDKQPWQVRDQFSLELSPRI
ncbi:recombinase family protein [Alicyclobacillus sp. ALC3]|uniref:recombinase family protein n=1 Tax=Alicyclobacillus sp. ALC3 TaxID=2796143 RepID=UPI002379B561|nr:recombinase family protein [Alicyclobacillus sp. ALC3]WDL98168.1 recombinase family protein [Alicyclobacillus sp. ALC3]